MIILKSFFSCFKLLMVDQYFAFLFQIRSLICPRTFVLVTPRAGSDLKSMISFWLVQIFLSLPFIFEFHLIFSRIFVFLPLVTAYKLHNLGYFKIGYSFLKFGVKNKNETFLKGLSQMKWKYFKKIPFTKKAILTSLCYLFFYFHIFFY